ncbi:MAG: pimeloyl-CoA dehydrogenase small subunit [Alphaproteobacteria bacterium]|nr:MAG: pimeloyl-CoA dehydrogenase small subunit [Alphaproteobacteria bacterium]
MEFALSDEQRLIAESAARFVADRYDFETRRRLAGGEEGFARENWRQFAELGWLALPFPEELGGLGGTAVEVMLLMEAFGRGLVLEPYLPAILLAGRAIAETAPREEATALLAPLLAGERIYALAAEEADSRGDLSAIVTTARRVTDGHVLAGRKAVVLAAPTADTFVVLARLEGEEGGEGLQLFLVPRESPGVTVVGYRTTDGGRAGELVLDDVAVPASAALGEPGRPTEAALERVREEAALAITAEILGLATAAFAATRQYLTTRHQFGRPLAAFQVLQHRLADMLIATEELRSIVAAATMRHVAAPMTAEARKLTAAAVVKALEAGQFVTAQAVQLHGGMGVSEELNIGTYFKHFHALKALLGDDHHALDRIALTAHAA